jgi:CubicO group peptidase (beta-lactamase class C family)
VLRRRILLLIVVVLLGVCHAAGQRPPLQELDKYITQAMHDLEVPGLAIAVVKDDTVVLAKGYGVRKLGEPAPVDEHTLFMIASTTKAFTVASLAMLVDEGKLKWDDPVLRYLPTFQLCDPYVTRELTVRDLLTHRTGLDSVDALVIGSAYSREEVLRRIRFLKPGSSFRSRFEYTNTMYIAAGQIIPAISGKSWDDFVRERIFRPLGMTDSSTSI